MSEESLDGLESVRLEKLRRIEALGLDPWGQRFDGHQPIESVRALGLPEGSDSNTVGPTVRVAGRIML
ncbi:lysine--tRNA ligase, partial [Singulisphaera rosea]